MNHIKLACCALIGSAAVLSGLLVAQLDNQFELQNTANAQFSTKTPNKEFLNAKISDRNFGLYVLNKETGTLTVYTTDISRNKVEFKGRLDVARQMNNVFGARKSDANRKRKSRTKPRR